MKHYSQFAWICIGDTLGRIVTLPAGSKLDNCKSSGISASWPLARIKISEDGITLYFLFFKKWFFPRESITNLSRINAGFFQSYFCIEHSLNYSKFIAFGSINNKKLRSKIEEFNYNIVDKIPSKP